MKLLTLIIIFIFYSSSSFSDEEQRNFITHFANGYVMPVHKSFVESSNKLHLDNKQFCKNINADNLIKAKESFKQVIIDWQAVQLVAFGAIDKKELNWRIQFYPDTKNLVEKKVKNILKGNEKITKEMMKDASVSIQGIPAIEYLLFDSKYAQISAYQSNARQCQLLQVVSHNLLKMSKKLNKYWEKKYLARLLDASNKEYMEDNEAVNRIVNAMAGKVDEWVNKKYLIVFGYHLKTSTTKPYLLDYWRSGYSLDALKAQLDAVSRFYYGHEKHNGLRDLIDKISDDKALLMNIDENFKELKSQLDESPAPLFTALREKNNDQKLKKQASVMNEFARLFHYEVPHALGVPAGYKFNDGD